MTAEASDLPIARSITQRLSMRKFLLDLLAFALVLIAPWFVLLGYHGYTLLAPEVLLVAMAAVAIAVILALASGLMGAPRSHGAVRPVAYVVHRPARNAAS
jgi:hypothetical protein